MSEGGEVSKNAQKKAAKLAEKQRLMEQKKKDQPTQASSSSSKKPTEEDELDPSKYLENRTKFLDAELGREAQYPHKFDITQQVPFFHSSGFSEIKYALKYLELSKEERAAMSMEAKRAMVQVGCRSFPMLLMVYKCEVDALYLYASYACDK
jgi:hypothetical protein